MNSLIIRNARVRSQPQPVDIAIDGARISAVGPSLAVKATKEIDAAGSLVLPGLFNLHFHADKCLLGEIMRPNLSGTLPEAIEITNDFKRKYDPAEVAARAMRVIEVGVMNGTTFFRLFADVGTIGGLRAARGLLLAREKMKNYCRHPGRGVPAGGHRARSGRGRADGGGRSRKAATSSADCPGTNTPTRTRASTSTSASISPSATISTSTCWWTTPTTPTRAASNISRSRRCAKASRAASPRAIAARWRGYNDVYAAKIVDMVATAGVTISVNAHINLVCSARIDREPKRRGIARVKELLARGVNVVTSQDDVNDPYYPFGKPDPLECASMMAHVAQLTLPHELEQVADMITVNSAKAARIPDYGIAAGCAADLVVVDAPSVHEAIREQPVRRHVFKDGREVARSVMKRELLP